VIAVLVALLVVGLIALQVVLLVSAMRTIARIAFEKAAETLDADLGPTEAERFGPAQCLGHDAPGVGSVRGTGALALTADELRFVLAAPRTRFTIARDDVTGTEVAAGFRRPGYAQRALRGELLAVHFTSAGRACVVGFQVRDPHAWAGALDRTPI